MLKSPLLKVQNLNVSFKTQTAHLHAVRGIDFEVFEGESIGIVGESGCGKTTAIQALCGLCRKGTIEGSAHFDGVDLLQEAHKVLGKKIGMVYQSPLSSLNPTMKIGSQIAEGMIYHGLATRKEAFAKALELLDLVGIPDPKMRAEQYPHELSGGQRQRVCIAIALACNPKLLIADEPTTALDVTIQAQIIRLIKEIQKNLKMSLILISHDMGVIGQIADRILVFYAGKIVEQGTAAQILKAPKHPYTQMLLQARPSPRAIQKTSPPLTMNIHNITKQFFFGKKCFTAVNNVSLNIGKGEILGLVGESGSGKSTLGKMILGLTSPTSGQILFEGTDISQKRNKNQLKEMQIIFQDPYASLNPLLTIESLIAEPTRIHKLPDRVDELLQLVGLPLSAKKRYPHEFSGGQRQRIAIARAIALNPKFLVCDEPISSLDITIQMQIVNLLIELKSKLSLTLLFISHDLAIVRYISDRIAVMKDGCIVEINETDALFKNPQHPYTRMLLSSIHRPLENLTHGAVNHLLNAERQPLEVDTNSK